MNEVALFDDERWRFLALFVQRTVSLAGRLGIMRNAVTALAIAVCGVSLICFALMTRAARGGNRRKASSDGTGSDGGTFASTDSGSFFWSWMGSGHSASDGEGHSSGSDGWGGGDSGGGGGDGGGGDRDGCFRQKTTRLLIYRNGGSLDSFQSEFRISLESLQKTVFPFASCRPLQYRRAPHHRWACRINDRLFL
jgi:hypothetical protein